ncbi:hypothetical protein [Falsiroseomonas sp. HW251]|uniref:hypothetical protein n=1 Tax=Falsiroseomonas sp. HW251 TaxID=3390998 RepID=UPI003D3215AA
MDPLTRLLIRLSQWFRNPPSRNHLAILGVVLVVAVVLVTIERSVGWPDWARTDPVPIRHR